MNDEDKFHIIDITGSKLDDFASLMAKAYEEGRQITMRPEPGIVYGLRVGQQSSIERLVFDEIYGRDQPIHVTFLDTGETTKMDRNMLTKLYELDEKYQKLPAMALKCRLNHVDGISIEKISIFLEENFKKKFEFKVVSIKRCICTYFIDYFYL